MRIFRHPSPPQSTFTRICAFFHFQLNLTHTGDTTPPFPPTPSPFLFPNQPSGSGAPSPLLNHMLSCMHSRARASCQNQHFFDSTQLSGNITPPSQLLPHSLPNSLGLGPSLYSGQLTCLRALRASFFVLAARQHQNAISFSTNHQPFHPIPLSYTVSTPTNISSIKSTHHLTHLLPNWQLTRRPSSSNTALSRPIHMQTPR